jgi:hypothetical protein
MNPSKNKTPPASAATTPASNEPHNYRINPEKEAKIDDWIKNNQPSWDYIKAMPLDRLRRTVVLNEVRRIENRERVDTEIIQEINNDPARKQAYDILTKDMPEEQREEVILKMEREKRWAKQESQSQKQPKKEAVTV